jgi:Flp pilus assembly protein TadB
MMNVTVAHVVYGYGLLVRLLLDMTLWRKEKRRSRSRSRSRSRDRRSRRRDGRSGRRDARSRRRDGRSRRRDGRSRRRDARSRRRTHRVMQGIGPLVVLVLMPGVVHGANAPWTIQKFHAVIKLLQSLLSLPLHTVCPPSTILFVGYAILGLIC